MDVPLCHRRLSANAHGNRTTQRQVERPRCGDGSRRGSTWECHAIAPTTALATAASWIARVVRRGAASNLVMPGPFGPDALAPHRIEAAGRQ